MLVNPPTLQRTVLTISPTLSSSGFVYLDTKKILIDGDNFLIFQDCLVVLLDGPQVHRHEERSSKYCPHRHLGLTLLVGQTEVPDDQLE